MLVAGARLVGVGAILAWFAAVVLLLALVFIDTDFQWKKVVLGSNVVLAIWMLDLHAMLICKTFHNSQWPCITGRIGFADVYDIS